MTRWGAFANRPESTSIRSLFFASSAYLLLSSIPIPSRPSSAAALSVEAGEVLEHFQWLSEEQSRSLPAEKREEIALELADVLLYLLRLSDQLQVDLLDAAKRKIKVNAKKYPVARARGSSKKYTEL